jgi:hypothetical protein
MTTSITHDECHITALDIDPEGQIYGGTSGHRAHLFVARFHDLAGVVLDAGAVPDSTNSVAVCAGTSRAIGFVNGARGGRAIVIPKIDLAQDWIQEWGLDPPVLIHAVSDPSRSTVIGVTTGHLFTMEIESGKLSVIGEVSGRGHLGMGSSGIFGQDNGARLWHFDLASGKIRRAAVDLPQGEWNSGVRWARGGDAGQLLTADDAGRIFSFDENHGFRSIGKAHLSPVGPMATIPDGRVFGFCGTEIANLFCCDTISGSMSNFGVAASVLQKRRYGYQFGDAVVGPQGEIVFGEDDNDGHLWLYFPKLKGIL